MTAAAASPAFAAGTRVLVTGGGGQLATEIVRHAPRGVELYAPSIAELDVTDRSAIAAWFARIAPQVVLHTAAYTAVDDAEEHAELADLVNHAAVGYLADACSTHRARLVHISTDYVFDGSSATPYLSDSAANPLSVYGRTKLAGEQAARACGDSLVVRTAWVYAAHGRNFLLTMLRLMRERPEVRVVADQIGSPTAAHRLASTLWLMAGRGTTGIHHWTDAGVASWYDFAVAIREEAEAAGLLGADAARIVPITTADYPTKARRPACSVLSKVATVAEIGTAPVHWREALRETLMQFAAQVGRSGGGTEQGRAGARPEKEVHS